MSLGLGNCSPRATVAVHSRWSPGCTRSVCCSAYCSTSAVAWPCGLFWCFHVWRRWKGRLLSLGGGEAHTVSLQHGGGNPWRQKPQGWDVPTIVQSKRVWGESQVGSWGAEFPAGVRLGWNVGVGLEAELRCLICSSALDCCCAKETNGVIIQARFYDPSKERLFCGENRIFSLEFYRPAATSAGVVSLQLKSLFICLFHLLLILCTNLSAWKNFQDILALWYEINATP